MSSTVEKLDKLKSTKNAIKAAIANKGVAVADNVPFSGYPEKIKNIKVGITPPVIPNQAGAAQIVKGYAATAADGVTVVEGTAANLKEKGKFWAKSNIGSGSWDTPLELRTGQLVSGSINKENQGFVYSLDKGKTWTKSDRITGSWNSPVEISSGELIGSSCFSANDGLVYSLDKGKTWQNSNITTGQWNNPIELSNGNLVCSGSKVVYSLDKGKTWQNCNNTDGDWNKPIELKAGELVCSCGGIGGGDGIIYSLDKGITWQNSNITVDSWYGPTELSTGALICCNYLGSGGIIYSLDKGKTWQNSDCSGGSWYAPIELRTGELVCGCSLFNDRCGLIYSLDKGVTWQNSNKTSEVWQTPVELSTGVLICGTGDSVNEGIIYSLNKGKTWQNSNITTGKWNNPIELKTGELVCGSLHDTDGNGIAYSLDKGKTWLNSNKNEGMFSNPRQLSTGEIVCGSGGYYFAGCGLSYSSKDVPVTVLSSVDSSVKTIDQEGNFVQGTGKCVKYLASGVINVAANSTAKNLINLPYAEFSKVEFFASHVLPTANDSTAFKALSTMSKSSNGWNLSMITASGTNSIVFDNSNGYSNIKFTFSKACTQLYYTVCINN